MKKILIDAERRKYPHSGVGFFSACLEQGLRELIAQGEGQGCELYFYGVDAQAECRHYAWHRLLNPTIWGKDLLHITHQLQVYFPHKPERTQCITTLHDLNFLYEDLSPKQKERRYKCVRANLERSDVIVCISHFVRTCLEEHRQLFRLKPNVRIEVIHNGLMFNDKPNLAPPQGLQPLPGEYLLCIGVLQDKKQQHLLLDMLTFLPQHISLVLVYSSADEAYLNYLNDLIVRWGLGRRVHFLAQVSAEAKQYLLANALAYVHPSKAEGFGIPPIEAMYLGRPVFLSRLTSLPEIGGHEAFYFDALEAQAMASRVMEGLEIYRADPMKSARLRAWAERYDYRRMAREYLTLYRSL